MSETDIIYVEGPGDLVESFRRWSTHEDFLTETSLTFSGQFFDFVNACNQRVLAISYNSEAKREIKGNFFVENRPKLILGDGILYHISQLLYGLQLVWFGILFRPKVIIVASGVTYWFIFEPLVLLKIKIVACMHNSLSPQGYKPKSLIKTFLLNLDSWFFRRICSATLCCSPEIQRQI